jgi:hypothetical protein
MTDWRGELGAQKSAATILVLFIPSVDRLEEPIDQDLWVTEALSVLGKNFGGATAGTWGLAGRRKRWSANL